MNSHQDEFAHGLDSNSVSNVTAANDGATHDKPNNTFAENQTDLYLNKPVPFDTDLIGDSSDSISSTPDNMYNNQKDSDVRKDELFNDNPNNFDVRKNESEDNNEVQMNLFDLTPDMEYAIRELELRKQRGEFDDDFDFGLYDTMPEYDVRDKLQSLNAQLASEPTPPEPEHRNSRVAFKDELVSLVAPPENYEGSESEEERSDAITNSELQSNKAKEAKLSTDLNSAESVEKTTNIDVSSPNHSNNAENVNDDSSANYDYSTDNKTQLNEDSSAEKDMIINRNGEYELIGSDDIISSSKNNHTEDEDKFNDTKYQNRPVSAPSAKRNRNTLSSSSDNSFISDGHVQSASANGRSKSKMDVPRVDREALRRQQDRQKEMEKKRKEEEDIENQKRKEMNESCFNAWLQGKQKMEKEEADKRKEKEEEDKKKKEKLQEERRNAALENEKELMKKRESDRLKEEKLSQYRVKEIEDAMNTHSKMECKRAFKQWLKRKQQENQQKVKEEKQRARITRLAMRQCRKSQNLAHAIHQANSFRYLDFYGYP